MPDLSQSLQGRDLGHLHIIANFWGIELQAPDVRTALPVLVKAMLDPGLIAEVIAGLSPQARSALQDLAQHDGRQPWAGFTRRNGELREMGPGRRDRDQPYLDPISPTELLWYHGLIARAFFDIPDGVDEFAYIPDDLRTFLLFSADNPPKVFGRPAYASERLYILTPSDRVLDHACTLLAALRVTLPLPDAFAFSPPVIPLPASVLQALLTASGVLLDHTQLVPESTRQFLEAPRAAALSDLVKAWLNSQDFNELLLIPGLSAEGSWRNDPLHTRQVLLGFLRDLPEGQFWSLDSFITAIKQNQPDFQRHAGEYDTWFIRSLETGEFLRGFDHWDQIEGALLSFFINGPLYWLGLVELASTAEGQPPVSFRLSAWSKALLSGEAPLGLSDENAKIIVRSDAVLHAPYLTPRTTRYQLARFCEWDKETQDGYDYRLTPASLARARSQGLAVTHLLALLRKSTDALPPSLLKALERWEAHGSQVKIEPLSVLRFTSPEVLPALRNSRAARFLGDPLGPAAIVIKAGAERKVLAVLSELGYLAEWIVKD